MDLSLDTSSATRCAETLRDHLTHTRDLSGTEAWASIFLIGSCTEDRIPESTWQDFDLHFALDTVYVPLETLDWLRDYLDALRRAGTPDCRIDGTVRDRHWKLIPDPSVTNNVGVHATLLSRADHYRRVSVHPLLADNMYTRCRVLRGIHPADWQGRRIPNKLDYLHSVGGLGWLSENLARAASLYLIDPTDRSFAPFVGGYCWNITGALLFHLYTLETGGIVGRHGALAYLRSCPDTPPDVLEQVELLESHRLTPEVDQATALALWDATGRMLDYAGSRILAAVGCGSAPEAWAGVREKPPAWTAVLDEDTTFGHVCRDESETYTNGVRHALEQARERLGAEVGVKEWPEFLRAAVSAGPAAKVQIWDRFGRLRQRLSHDYHDDWNEPVTERAIFGWEDGAQALLQRLNEWSILYPGEDWLDNVAHTFHRICRRQLGSVGIAVEDAESLDRCRRTIADALAVALPLRLPRVDFYELMRAAESLQGNPDAIDLSSGSPLVFEQISSIALNELAAPRWISPATLGAYADYDGLPAFTELICERWSSSVGRQLRSAEVMVTPGAQGALSLLQRWLAERGRRILYPLGVEFPGAVTREYPVAGVYASVAAGDGGTRAVLPDPEVFDWRKVGAVLLSQPHNPTTVAFTAEELRPLLVAARHHDAVMVFDRTYALPGAPMAVDPPTLPAEAIHIFSFSKVGLASERTGVLIGPEEVIRELCAVQRRLFLQTPKVGQALAAALLDAFAADPALGAMVGHTYRQRWDELAGALKETVSELIVDGDLRLHVWQGGPFLWAELPAGVDVWEFTDSCLRAGVVIMPGESLAVRPESLPTAAFRLGLGQPVGRLSEAGTRLGRVLCKAVSGP